MNIVQFTDLISNTTSTANMTSMKNFLALPLLEVVFAVVMVIAGIGLIASLIFWIGRKIANMVHPQHDTPQQTPHGSVEWGRGGYDIHWK